MSFFHSVGKAFKGIGRGVSKAVGGLFKGATGLFRGQKIPDIEIPTLAQPLEQPQQLPEAPELGESDAERLKRKRGKKSLRIDLSSSANTGGGGSGANIV